MAKIKGIWVLNAVIKATESASTLAQAVNFTSNGITFDRMLLLADYTSAMTYSNIADSYSVYTHSGGWVNEAFRIVDFGTSDQEVSDAWYAGFTANGTQVGGEEEQPEEGGELIAIWKSTLDGIADAVRSKTGKTEQMLGSEIEDEIRSIEAVEEWDGTVEVI